MWYHNISLEQENTRRDSKSPKAGIQKLYKLKNPQKHDARNHMEAKQEELTK